ncbi:MAG: hypothetical protein ACR2QC_00230 [Gammaproteobacteria bacterium]
MQLFFIFFRRKPKQAAGRQNGRIRPRKSAHSPRPIPAKAGISLRESANDSPSANKIPAFAGMGLWGRREISRLRRGDSGFRRNGSTFDLLIKIHHSGESRNLIPIPAKAGISAAAKRRVIVRLYAFGDSLRLSARRFLPSQEWDGWAEIGRGQE